MHDEKGAQKDERIIQESHSGEQNDSQLHVPNMRYAFKVTEYVSSGTVIYILRAYKQFHRDEPTSKA